MGWGRAALRGRGPRRGGRTHRHPTLTKTNLGVRLHPPALHCPRQPPDVRAGGAESREVWDGAPRQGGRRRRAQGLRPHPHFPSPASPSARPQPRPTTLPRLTLVLAAGDPRWWDGGRWAPGPVALPQARVEGTGGWIGGRRRRRRGGGEEEEEGEKEGGGRKVAGRGRGGGEEGKARRRTRRKAGRQRRPVTGTSAAAARGRRDRSRGCAPERDFTTNPVCKLLFIFRKVCQTWALIFRPDFPLVARSRTRSHIIYDCLWS